MLETLVINNDIEFIFEEGSGCGPTDVQRLAETQVPVLRYLDIDPHPNERAKHGLAIEDGTLGTQIGDDPRDSYWEEYIDPQMQREHFWLQRIKEQQFTRALFICGYLHLFSFGSKLRATGWKVKCFCYMPHHKLCSHEE